MFQKIIQLIAWKKTGKNRCVYDFSADYSTFDVIILLSFCEYSQILSEKA